MARASQHPTNLPALHKLITQLAIIRETSGLTIDDAAKAMGVDKAAVSKLERGLTNPTLLTVARYADAVGATLAPIAVPRAQGQQWTGLAVKVLLALDNETELPTTPTPHNVSHAHA